jgi:hypothetical protein
MRKIKIMLLTLPLLAVVGGVLAFKAKYGQDFCAQYTTSAICEQGLTCPNKFINYIIDVNAPPEYRFFCTTTPVDGNCPDNLLCSTTAPVYLKADIEKD